MLIITESVYGGYRVDVPNTAPAGLHKVLGEFSKWGGPDKNTEYSGIFCKSYEIADAPTVIALVTTYLQAGR